MAMLVITRGYLLFPWKRTYTCIMNRVNHEPHSTVSKSVTVVIWPGKSPVFIFEQDFPRYYGTTVYVLFLLLLFSPKVQVGLPKGYFWSSDPFGPFWTHKWSHVETQICQCLPNITPALALWSTVGRRIPQHLWRNSRDHSFILKPDQHRTNKWHAFNMLFEAMLRSLRSTWWRSTVIMTIVRIDTLW